MTSHLYVLLFTGTMFHLLHHTKRARARYPLDSTTTKSTNSLCVCFVILVEMYWEKVNVSAPTQFEFGQKR